MIQKILDFFSKNNEKEKPIKFVDNESTSQGNKTRKEDNAEIVDPNKLKVEKLIRNLNARDTNREKQKMKRLEASLALAKFGKIATPAIPILVEKLFDIVPEIRKASKFTLEAIDPNFYLHQEVIDKIPFLIKRLEEKQRATATSILIGMGDKANDYLIKYLKDDPEEYAAIKVIQVLSQIRPYHKEVFNLIIAKINNSKTEDIVEAGIIALGNLAFISEEILDLLVYKLSKEHASSIRKAVLKTFQKFGEESLIIIPRIINCFGDDQLEIRQEAINTVVKIGPSTIPYLLELLHKKEGYTAADLQELKNRFEGLIIDNSKVQMYMSNFQKYNNVAWYIEELKSVLNRPVRLNDGIIQCLLKLGHFNEDDKKRLNYTTN